jgi:acetyltransferase-like isoleucine patch superfamily enzyme
MNFYKYFKYLYFRIRLFRANDYEKSKVYANYLEIKMGDNVRITGKIFFGSEPYLIAIGNNVTLTHGVIFHNHDGGVGVLRSKYPNIDVIKPIVIGDNVFIGSCSTIMPGVKVGNNVIIGASSVVTRDVPDNVVVAGVPAKFIKTIAEYEEKTLKEAIFIKNRGNPSERKIEILNNMLKQ